MVVGDFNLISVSFTPIETHPPFLVDPDAVLAGAVPPELLESVPRRNPEVRQLLGGIEHHEFA